MQGLGTGQSSLSRKQRHYFIGSPLDFISLTLALSLSSPFDLLKFTCATSIMSDSSSKPGIAGPSKAIIKNVDSEWTFFVLEVLHERSRR